LELIKLVLFIFLNKRESLEIIQIKKKEKEQYKQKTELRDDTDKEERAKTK
jgi:hypothetical protein